MAKLTSRVPDTWFALYQLLTVQTYPRGEGIPDDIPVVFAAADRPLLEAIVVVGSPPTQASLDWVTNLSEEEMFTLQVRIVTELPGRTVEQAFARMRELGDVIQNALRDPATGRITNAFNGASATHPVPGVISWRLAQYRSQGYLTTAGMAAVAELDFLFKARI